MTRLERRQSARMIVEGFAYINIDPNNGGSVLNVSEGGLCFHSIAPVHRNRTIRFWFAEQDRRIEGAGELAWMDEAQKTGGVRFTSLSAEAREQIRRWTSLAAVPLPADKQPRPAPGFGASRLGPKDVHGGSTPVAMALPKPIASNRLSAFSRGLATGLLVAVVVAVGFSFHTYRQDFGEWLIQLGQQFAAKPAAQAPPAQPAVMPAQQTVPPAQNTVLSAQQVAPPAQSRPSPASRVVVPTAPAPVPQPEKQPAASPVKPLKVKRAPAKAPGTSPAPPAISPLAAALSSDVIPGKPVALPELATNPPETTNPPSGTVEVAREESGKGSAGPPPEMYFEVGKFKNPSGAYQVSDKLAQLGFPSSVIQKGRLWTSSYVVLAGPYSDENTADAAGKALLSHDFRPRPFERGTRDIALRPGLTLNGARIPGGDCTIRWESYVTGTVIKVEQGRSVVATGNGRWDKRGAKYKRDAFVYRKNPDGSRTLLEIQFAGLSRALVFGKAS